MHHGSTLSTLWVCHVSPWSLVIGRMDNASLSWSFLCLTTLIQFLAGWKVCRLTFRTARCNTWETQRIHILGIFVPFLLVSLCVPWGDFFINHLLEQRILAFESKDCTVWLSSNLCLHPSGQVLGYRMIWSFFLRGRSDWSIWDSFLWHRADLRTSIIIYNISIYII